MAYGDRMTTFEDSEKESEYGYVRKVRTFSPKHHNAHFIHNKTKSSFFKILIFRCRGPSSSPMEWAALPCTNWSALATTISSARSSVWREIQQQSKVIFNLFCCCNKILFKFKSGFINKLLVVAVWISVYEETAGLMVNDPVLRTRKVFNFQ